MNRIKLLLVSLFALQVMVASAVENLIPTPKQIEVRSSKRVVPTTVEERIDSSLDLPDEGYMLEVRGRKVMLRAKSERGMVWARVTLDQLKGADGTVPTVKIKDWPSFPIRAFMHDTGRNFRTVEMLKRDIELMSAYKINAFHWHLTDNPAWRIECRCYPQLNDARYHEHGRDEGKFYTYDEIRDVIAFAKARGVMIIPEIDMPGHSRYFPRTFGFKMETKEGMEVLRRCLEEFFAEIPVEDCPYFHIGSDEVKVPNPKEFMTFCEEIVRRHGRVPMAWHPGLEASQGTVRQIWHETLVRDEDMSRYSFPYVDSYLGYLNHNNSLTNVATMFLHQTCSVPEATDKALGGVLCLWNDVRVDEDEKLMRHNGMPECLLACSERFWGGGKSHGLDIGSLVPAPDSEAHKLLSAFERKVAWHRDNRLYDWDMRWVANADIAWRVRVARDGKLLFEDKYWGGSINMAALCSRHKVKMKAGLTVTAEAEVYSEAERDIEAWVAFETPSRATRASAGIGAQRQWEHGGLCTLNGKKVSPRKKWREPGAYAFHYNTWSRWGNELPYTDEQLFWMRDPAKMHLEKGWNRLKMECTLIFTNRSGNFWKPTFVPVQRDAKGHVREVEGLSYRVPQGE